MTYPAGFTGGGAPLGFGSSFHVVRALAVGGQLIRVVFSEEPRHSSMSGLSDARNASNYAVSILTGTGHVLHSVATMETLASFPSFGLFAAGEWGVDVQLDREMIVGMSYRVQVSTALVSATGVLVGWPFSADFVGAARPRRDRQVRRKMGLVDLASDPFKGGITVDSSGDWASQEGIDGTRKRVWRIPQTMKGRFVWMPGFGLAYDIKKPATISILGGLRTDLRQQLQQQPDIKGSESSVVMDARGFLELGIKAKTSTGEQIDESHQFTQGGVTT